MNTAGALVSYPILFFSIAHIMHQGVEADQALRSISEIDPDMLKTVPISNFTGPEFSEGTILEQSEIDEANDAVQAVFDYNSYIVTKVHFQEQYGDGYLLVLAKSGPRFARRLIELYNIRSQDGPNATGGILRALRSSREFNVSNWQWDRLNDIIRHSISNGTPIKVLYSLNDRDNINNLLLGSTAGFSQINRGITSRTFFYAVGRLQAPNLKAPSMPSILSIINVPKAFAASKQLGIMQVVNQAITGSS